MKKSSKKKKLTLIILVKFLKTQFILYKETNFLIILDDLIDAELIESFLVNMPENVHVLITTRNSGVLSKFKILDNRAEKLGIKYFSKENARLFFYKNINTEMREVTSEETLLLENYFSETNILPYDLHLLVSVLNENQLLDVKGFFERDKQLCEKIFDSLYKVIQVATYLENYSTFHSPIFVVVLQY